MSIRPRAVRFAMDEIMRSTESQEVEHALANHAEFGPWLHNECGDGLATAQAIISEAEEKLGSKMPAAYG